MLTRYNGLILYTRYLQSHTQLLEPLLAMELFVYVSEHTTILRRYNILSYIMRSRWAWGRKLGGWEMPDESPTDKSPTDRSPVDKSTKDKTPKRQKPHRQKPRRQKPQKIC